MGFEDAIGEQDESTGRSGKLPEVSLDALFNVMTVTTLALSRAYLKV